MNKKKKNTKQENNSGHFLSIVAFRETHSELLSKSNLGVTQELIREVIDFIDKGRILGQLLDDNDDRWSAQGILDYWATVLFRADYDAPDVMLAEYNWNFAPNLENIPCPYCGLDAFQEENHANFFGRERIITEILEKLSISRFVCIVGTSGSGKSSVVRAGIIPALKNGAIENSTSWNYYPALTPGKDPLSSLAKALSPKNIDVEKWVYKQTALMQKDPSFLSTLFSSSGLGMPVVLFVDQFEEIFTLCTDEALRKSFVSNLLNLVENDVNKHVLIITMRIDFLERLSQFPGFQSAFQKNTVILPRLRPDELREVIEGPANRISLKFEDGVVDSLISDVRDDQSPLPLLQFALLKLWDNKFHNKITMKSYLELEGAHGALPKSATTLYEGLALEEKRAVRNILVKLSRQPEKGQEVTRDRLSIKRLFDDSVSKDRIEWALDRLVNARLIRINKGMTDDETMVEIAHEALVRNWQPLVDWLDEERSEIRQRDRFAKAAEHWDSADRDVNVLWRGIQLENALSYRNLSPIEESFIKASLDAIEEEKKQEVARQVELERVKIQAEHERKNAEKFRKLYEKLDEALLEVTKEKERAEKQARLSFSRELAVASVNNLNVDPERSVLLAMEAVKATKRLEEGVTLEAEDALHRALQYSRIMFTLSGHLDQVRGIAYSPDGSLLITASQDNTVKIWNTITGEDLFTLQCHSRGILDVAFSHTGRYFATASRDGTAKIWNAKTYELISVLNHKKEVFGLAFNGDDTKLATASADETAVIWDTTTGRIVYSFYDHVDRVNKAVFSPDGSRLITISRDKTAKVWDVKTGEHLGDLVDKDIPGHFAHTGEVIDLAFSPDGRYIVTTGEENDIKIWNNLLPREKVTSFVGHSSWVESVAFSKDGKFLATAGQDGIAKIWDFEKFDFDKEIITLVGHSHRIYKIAFNNDGKQIATAGRDGVAKIWNMHLNKEIFAAGGQDEKVTSARFSPDGIKMVTTFQNSKVAIWNWGIHGFEIDRHLKKHKDKVIKAVFSKDGHFLATASKDSSVIVWDIQTGTDVYSLEKYRREGIIDISLSPDATLLAVAFSGGKVDVWDIEIGEVRFTVSHENTVNGVSFSPVDGKYIVTVSEDGTVKVWNGREGSLLLDFKDHMSGVNCLSFNSDGSFFATGSYDKNIIIWSPVDGKIIRTLSGHTQGIIDVSISLNDRYLASASDDGVVKVWDIQSGQELLNLSAYSERIYNTSFNPASTQLVISGNDGVARVYAISIDDLLALAKSRVTRSFRPDEYRKYFRDNNYKEIIDGKYFKSTALWLLVRGKNFARGKNIHWALECFNEALSLDSEIMNFDFETEARRLAEGLFNN